jgi:hypothetical protein
MRNLAILLVLVLAAAPSAASAQRSRGGGGGGGYHPPANQGRGFNMSNDAPTKSASGSNGSAAYNKNTGNAAAYNKNTGTATTYNNKTNTTTQYNKNSNTSTSYNKNTNTYNSNTYNNYNKNDYNSGAYNGKNSAGAYNKNTGNAAVYNKNTGNMTVYNKNTGTSSTYHYNNNGKNGYYYTGRVVVNPVYVGPAWGWNRGVVWAPVGAYWAGGFWGAFAIGASVAAMGYVVYQNQHYTSYSVSAGSPGATLLSNYGLRQVPCGPPGLVVLYGPNFGAICAEPNGRVGAGSYAVNVDSLTIQSQ